MPTLTASVDPLQLPGSLYRVHSALLLFVCNGFSLKHVSGCLNFIMLISDMTSVLGKYSDANNVTLADDDNHTVTAMLPV